MSEMKKDDLIYTAFREKETLPPSWETRAMALIAERRNQVKKSAFARILSHRMAAVGLALLLIMPAAVYAGFQLLGAEDVAQLMDNAALAEAFDCQERDVVTVVDGNYTISLLGIISEETAENYDSAASSDKGSTYAAVAVQRTDGQPIETYDDAEFYISPLIEGLNPKEWNIAAFGNSCSKILRDGVLYVIAEWDDFAVFGDRQLYVAVIEDALAPMPEAVCYDETTGQISANSAYDKANVIFSVESDVKKADSAAAEKKIQEICQKREAEQRAAYMDPGIRKTQTDGVTFMTQNGRTYDNQWSLSLFVDGANIKSVTVQANRGKILQPERISKVEYEQLCRELEKQGMSGENSKGIRLQAVQGQYLVIDSTKAQSRIQVDWHRLSADMWGEEALIVCQKPNKAEGMEFEIIVTRNDGSKVRKVLQCSGITDDGRIQCQFAEF